MSTAPRTVLSYLTCVENCQQWQECGIWNGRSAATPVECEHWPAGWHPSDSKADAVNQVYVEHLTRPLRGPLCGEPRDLSRWQDAPDLGHPLATMIGIRNGLLYSLLLALTAVGIWMLLQWVQEVLR